jgi:DDE superfamily endonuclease
VVLDNVGCHKGQAARRWWVAHRGRIRPMWLPAYTPELNLSERVWRHLKDKLSCHRQWADLDALQQITESLLRRLRARFYRSDQMITLPRGFCESALALRFRVRIAPISFDQSKRWAGRNRERVQGRSDPVSLG